MNIADPSPPACAALLLALPLCACAGAGLARRASADDDTRRIVTPAASFALWLVSVYVLGRFYRAFLPGLVGGTLLCALLGVPHAARLLRERRSPDGEGARPRLPVWIFAALGTLAIFPSVLCYFHDEFFIGGPIAMVSHLENGYFPPRYVAFPQFELSYHYGFSVAAAALAMMLRLPPWSGIDAATLLAWVYTALLGCHLGRKLGGAGHGVITGMLVLFGGGIHLGCAPPGAPLGQHMIGYCEVDGLPPNPPLGSYFFQHPFAAGIPLFLAIVCLLADRESGPLRARYALFAVLLVALAHCQIVLFVCCACSLLAAEGVVERRIDPRRAISIGIAVVAAFVVARALGGVLAPSPQRTGSSLLLHLGATDSLEGTLLWHARSYGVLLPAGLAGLVVAKRARLFLALMIGGCLVVPNVLCYAYTWDIVKFTTVGELSLALSAGCLFPYLLDRRDELAAPTRLAVVGFCTVLAVSMVGWSASFHATTWLKTPGTSFDDVPEMDETDADVAGRLRRLVPADESVYRRHGPSRPYGQFTGLSIPWLDDADGSGFSPDLVSARQQFLDEMPVEAADWDREGVRWLVLDDYDTLLRSCAEIWVSEGRAEVVFEVDNLRVVHLLGHR